MSFTSVQNGCVSDSRLLIPIHSVPSVKEKEPSDPNIANPRLTINRALIYERRLPGDAYITAHVQRLQHGYYSSAVVSDQGAECVDFLAIAFTFHSPHTITHRIRSANISVSVRGNCDLTSSKSCPCHAPGNPRFLMHAPHLLYGIVSPETMEWKFSLAGSLGISELPVSASVVPSGSLSGRYKRYEMMRIQGSARTLKSPAGREFDVEAGKIVWSMEENNFQRSGLPREFTFVMLIQKLTTNSNISLSIDVDPVIDAMIGNYPSLLLKLPEYQPLPCRGVDFQQEVGQRFEPADPVRGFNFAELGGMFDEYIAMPGGKFSRQIQIPAETGTPDNHFQGTCVGQYGPPNPIPYQQQLQTHNLALQNSNFSRQNNLLQTTLKTLWTTQPKETPQSRKQHQNPPPPSPKLPT
ncbi:GCN5-related N-acetyltransferase protein [Penicillium digitatum]|uniref:GCN5-related N-acetyltransferase protein n=1 Tax=Penicillium digitatum TaxID=36651 RepID=A0A7T6XQN3_PENDI|nr:GCN5-related N-acetyltransferase protein [Penicillium digitatum]